MDDNADHPLDEPHTGREPRPDGATEEAAATGLVQTGNPAVDQVLRSIEGLSSRPVPEHVDVFEAAHEALRRALSDAGEPRSDQTSSDQSGTLGA